MTNKINNTSGLINTTASINTLPTKLQQTFLNYISPRETAVTIHSVQHSWKNLLRNDGCLDLSNTKITDADLARIVQEYKGAGAIVSINLSGCSKITDNGLKHLATLPLQQLTLWHCYKITDKGLETLSHLPLQQLNLGHCYKITDKGLALLSQLPLQKLNLARCYKITDQGLASLSRLPLKELNLWGCSKITDQSLQMLSQIPLQMLNLDNTKITDAKRMSETLPLAHYFHENDFLHFAHLARQVDDYSVLHKLVLEYI